LRHYLPEARGSLDDMKLYHGSNVHIDVIDLSKGKKGKDFGQGFYLSALYTQAFRMAELTPL